MNRKRIALGEETRVFRMTSSPWPGCISGQTVNGYANKHGAILMTGCHCTPFTEPEMLRELIANLELLAQRIESERKC